MKKIDKPIYVNLGKQLKMARINKGYSLAEVAEKVGRSKASIKRYEDASVRIDMDTLNKIADLLDMQVMDLTTTHDGKQVERAIGIYPKLEALLKEDRELQEAGIYFEQFTEKMMKKFMCLDINLQKSMLMMLNFEEDEIEEIMNFLH